MITTFGTVPTTVTVDWSAFAPPANIRAVSVEESGIDGELFLIASITIVPEPGAAALLLAGAATLAGRKRIA